MPYTPPAGDEADLTFSGQAVARPSGAHAPFSPTYAPPHGSAAHLIFPGVAYTAPDGDAANFGQPVGEGVTGVGEVTLSDLIVMGAGAHGVSGTGSVTLPELLVVGIGTHDLPGVEGSGAVTLPDLVVTGVGAHGVAGLGFVTLGDVLPAGTGGHGVAGVGTVTLGPMVVVGVGAHGVAGAGVVTLGDLEVEGVAIHPRHSLKGEVRVAGVLVNRVVRAYRLDTGALVGEQATDAGRFEIHAGFEAREHYILPLDMSEGATDWAPPVANHVLSVLVQD